MFVEPPSLDEQRASYLCILNTIQRRPASNSDHSGAMERDFKPIAAFDRGIESMPVHE
jgi:hypothetical protein